MIARLTRLLLLLQIALAGLLGMGIRRLWPVLPLWAAILIGVSVVLLLRAFITANNFRLAASVPNRSEPATALGFAGAIGLYAKELRATLISSSWTMPFVKSRVFFASQQVAPPVLLVHGYGCNGGFWHHLGKQLKAADISYFAIDLEPVLGGIECYIPKITAAVEALRNATGQKQIVIVAHSMGGLAARAWLRAQGGTRIAKLITLGTPHAGTTLARFGPGENSRQMRYSDTDDEQSWLAQLNAATAPALPIVSIYSVHDNIIAPSMSSHLPCAHNIRLSGIGHVALGSDPAAMSIVVEEIRRTPLSADRPERG